MAHCIGDVIATDRFVVYTWDPASSLPACMRATSASIVDIHSVQKDIKV